MGSSNPEDSPVAETAVDGKGHHRPSNSQSTIRNVDNSPPETTTAVDSALSPTPQSSLFDTPSKARKGFKSALPSKPSYYVRDPTKMVIKSIDIFNENMTGDSSTSLPRSATSKLSIFFNRNISTQSEDLIEFVQDPDPESHDLLIKLPSNELVLHFKLSVNPRTPISNLTFICASSSQHLEYLITKEFFHNPNFQNEDNVVLIGDFGVSDGSSNEPSKDILTTDFTWKWKSPPPVNNSSFSSKYGVKTVFGFVEYDKREHSLQLLASFSAWIAGPLRNSQINDLNPLNTAASTLSPPSPTFELSPVDLNISPTNTLTPSTAYIPTESSSRSRSISSLAINGNPFGGSTGFNGAKPKPKMNATLSPSEEEYWEGLSSLLPARPSLPKRASIEPSTDHDGITKVLQAEKKLSLSIPWPTVDSSSQPEDGPLFRATITSLEKRTGFLKMKIKKLLKRAVQLHEQQMMMVETQNAFTKCLSDISASEIPSFRSIVDLYFDRPSIALSSNNDSSKRMVSTGFRSVIEGGKQNARDIQFHIIEPLRRLYDQEIKSFEIRKREFDDESREYYSWLSRYLAQKQEPVARIGGKKKLMDSDSKYQDKRKAFELTRFDYYSYMNDLHGGRKLQQVTYHLALFAESEVDRLIVTSDRLRSSVKSDLDSVVNEVKAAHREWSRHRTEREDRRRALERSIGSPLATTSMSSIAAQSLSSATAFSGTSQVGLGSSPGFFSSGLGLEYYDDDNSNDTMDEDEYLVANDETENVVSGVNNNGGVGSGGGLTSYAYGNSGGNNISNNMVSLNSHAPLDKVGLKVRTGLEEIKKQLSPVADETNWTVPEALVDREDKKKEGLLWAMSRPGGLNDPIALNKPGWHKFWVVLASGKLCEYTNWKQRLDLHMEPIRLEVACVREARNADRRFCFEVVTPSYKRVYQATSEEDMHSWINAINSGISSSLESSKIMESETGSRNDGGPHSSSEILATTAAVSSFRPLSQPAVKANSRSASVSEKSPSSKTGVSVNQSLLEVVRRVDSSNRICADCGGNRNVEWISINLLVIICIECSGIHRSLGSHISKVRSLTLDTVSFTPELLELIRSVHNSQINSIWEAKYETSANKAQQQLGSPTASLHQDQSVVTKSTSVPKVVSMLDPIEPTPTATIPTSNGPKIVNRKTFITEKYVEKKFVDMLDRPNAALREYVRSQDLKGILHALASRANPNITVPVTLDSTLSQDSPNSSEPLIVYALRTAPPNFKTFAVAELLILNSASLPSLSFPISNLNKDAMNYLQRRASNFASSGTTNATNQPISGTTAGGTNIISSSTGTVVTSSSGVEQVSSYSNNNNNNINNNDIGGPIIAVGDRRSMSTKIQKRLSSGFKTT